MKQFVPILLLVLLFSSCVSQQRADMPGGLSPKLQNLVTDAVFEVIVRKPAEQNIVYERELDWTLIPFAIRNDEYYSIGTAFAISSTEAITAFHVVNLNSDSKIYTEYFIRDSGGNVYEIDKIHKASNEKDFLVFTVKDRTFDTWFELNPNFRVNSQVYSIGNALGEGIVVRNGLLLGTVPENEDGRWNMLTSSADGNPGNSGGPLVTPDGRVVGVVVALRDNILYSLPVSDILSAPSDTAIIRRRYTYGHLLLSNQLTQAFELNAALPKGYKELLNEINEGFMAFYPGPMTELFSQAPDYLEGPNNRFLLHQVVESDFPEFAFVDRNDNQWKISDLRVQGFSLPSDGAILQAEVSGFILIKIRRPKTISVEKINTDPRTIMDTYLSGSSMERHLGSTGRFRILSLGDPSEVSEYLDSQGRTWIKTYWLLDFADLIMIAYILPMPNGPVILLTRQRSSDLHIYQWDMEATCDRIFAAYRGDMEEWTEYLSLEKWIPSLLEPFTLELNEENSNITLEMPQLSLSADESVFSWTMQSTLFMAPAYYMADNSIEYGIRTIIMEQDLRGNDYFVITKHVKPDERLGTGSMQFWNDVNTSRHPFDKVSRLSARDNSGTIAGILNHSANVSDDVRYSLYLTMENPDSEEILTERYMILEEEIAIHK